MKCGCDLACLAWCFILYLRVDQNQSGFSDSKGFPLDTNDPDPMRNIGFADSGGFELNTAE